MNRKFKIGDRVQLKREYIDWLIAWIPEGYSVHGKHKQNTTDDLALFAVFASREFDKPLRGKVTECLGDDAVTPTVRVEFENEYGTYRSIFDEQHVTRLRKVRRCKNCGHKT